ncbi:MAG: glycine C-acetyltransferase, partial [Myxococcales bacterium]|nr:glycine C-acetyltransferase [Myxococcales bacterium]
MGFQSQIQEALSELEASGLLRTPLRISGPQGPEVLIDGKPVL